MKNCDHMKMNAKAFEYVTEKDGPGPAAYGIKSTVGKKNRLPTIPNEPAFTAYPRLRYSDETESPGPVYNLQHLTCRGRADGPKYSMGTKKVENSETDSPGPAAYMLKSDRGPKLKILLPLKNIDSKIEYPGPNAYKLPSTLTKKGITLAKKIDPDIEIKSPGPAGYKMVPLNKYKKKAPNYSLPKGFEDPLLADEMKATAPGPQAYNPTLKFKFNNVPKYSFGIRRTDKFAPMVVCDDVEIKRK